MLPARGDLQEIAGRDLAASLIRADGICFSIDQITMECILRIICITGEVVEALTNYGKKHVISSCLYT